ILRCRNSANAAHDRQLEYLISITSRCRAVSTDKSTWGKASSTPAARLSLDPRPERRRQPRHDLLRLDVQRPCLALCVEPLVVNVTEGDAFVIGLSLIHISEPTRRTPI